MLTALLFIAACAQTPKPEASKLIAPSLAPLPKPSPRLQLEIDWSSHGYRVIGESTDVLFFSGDHGTAAVRPKDGKVKWSSSLSCTAALLSGEELYAACGRNVLALNPTSGAVVRRSKQLRMERVEAIVPAGAHALATEGWADGASLRNILDFFDKNTLATINSESIEDSTFLGVIGERAYVDDWCCNGRADTYAPATIYSISLRDGSKRDPVDLYPQPEKHPASQQPLGQGSKNYLRGHYFYVVVGDTTYRYDVFNLKKPFTIMRTGP